METFIDFIFLSRFDCGSSLAKHMTADHGIVAKFTQGKGNRYKITEGDAAISLLPQEKTEAVNTSINSSPFKVPKLKKKKKAPQKVGQTKDSILIARLVS